MTAKQAADASKEGHFKSTEALVEILKERVKETASQGAMAFTFRIPETVTEGVLDATIDLLLADGYNVSRSPSRATLFVSWRLATP